jgi:hypothetical protein
MDMTGAMEGPEGGGRIGEVHLIIYIDGKNHPAMALDRPCQQGIISGCFRQDDIENDHLRFFHPLKKGRIVKPPERPSPQFFHGFLVNLNEEDILRRGMRAPQSEGKIVESEIRPFKEAEVID